MNRFETIEGESLTCPECGHDYTGTVSIDTLAGVAATTCPECDRTQEPVDA